MPAARNGSLGATKTPRAAGARRSDRTASRRARTKSRIASCPGSGTHTAVNSPARCSFARLAASRRSVLIRSPASGSAMAPPQWIRAGAPTTGVGYHNRTAPPHSRTAAPPLPGPACEPAAATPLACSRSGHIPGPRPAGCLPPAPQRSHPCEHQARHT